MSARPLALPLPLGFLALAAGTTLLAALQLGWLSSADGRDVAVALLAFVAPLQGVASLVGFLSGDLVAATGMGLLAGTWATTGITVLESPPGATSAALGTLLLTVAVALLLPAGGAVLRGGPLPGAVIGGAAVRFALTGGYEIAATRAWERAAGAAGLALAVLAVGAAVVLVVRAARGEPHPDA